MNETGGSGGKESDVDNFVEPGGELVRRDDRIDASAVENAVI